MAKKGKSKVASNASSKVEVVPSNENFVESVPTESVETEEAATTMILDKSEGVVKKDETDDGSDSEEESEEIENDLDESDGTEKNEDGLYESMEGVETDEIKDGIDASDDTDKIGEIKEAPEKNDEGVTEVKTLDGKVESVGTDGPEIEKAGARDVTVENVSNRKANRIRNRMKKGAAGTAASNAANKSSESDKQEPKEDGKVEPVGTDGPESENVEERDVTGEVKDNGKGENGTGKKAKRTRRRKKKGPAAATASNDANKQETSAAAKDMKMTDGMGLIFMCNAKTKSECFNNKIFGLPAGKKDMVAKVYKGMRLFLYDIDLKLMHGIYKAASPGGYNIEPEAFKSAFPSQVRFTVLKDCSPLPEEKFKVAIKENYYGRNRFNCQLSREQVKKLCELFQSAGQTPKKTGEQTPKKTGEVTRAEQEPNSSSRGRKRNRREGEAPRANQGRGSPARGQKRSRGGREVIRGDLARSSSRGRNTSRREIGRRDDRIPRGRDLYARRDAYISPPRRLLAQPPPFPSAPYAYVPPVDDHYYRPDQPLIDGFVPATEMRAYVPESRIYDPIEYRDPYRMYREPQPREPLYRDQALYREPLSREPVPYSTSANPTSLTYGAYDPSLTHYRY